MKVELPNRDPPGQTHRELTDFFGFVYNESVCVCSALASSVDMQKKKKTLYAHEPSNQINTQKMCFQSFTHSSIIISWCLSPVSDLKHTAVCHQHISGNQGVAFVLLYSLNVLNLELHKMFTCMCVSSPSLFISCLLPFPFPFPLPFLHYVGMVNNFYIYNFFLYLHFSCTFV